jgi:hypothetical protein
MLRFFRKIRKKHLTSGKTFSYLKYAVGEIVLVVVGILIALQINNWSEARKRANSEQQILSSIKSSLVNDTLVFAGAARNARRSNKAIKLLLTRPALHDSLTNTFVAALSATAIQSNTSAFEQLKSLGFEIVKNDSLRDRLVKHYDYNLERGILRNRHNLINFSEEIFYPFYRKHISFSVSDTSFSDFKYLPTDYENLMDNPEFTSLLLEKWIYNTQTSEEIIALLNRQSHELIEAIDKELEAR